MWYFLYNIILLVSAPVIILILLLKKRCRPGFRQRMGLALPEGFSSDKEVLWIHAVSMGEVLAVVPLVTTIHHAYPHLAIIISTITDTGREAVEQRLSGIARHCYLPLDWPWTVRRFIRHLRPKAFFVVETELWPNLLKELQAHGVSNVLVNGRLSTKSFEGYLRVKSFMKQVLSSFRLCLVQSDRDAQRLIALGANCERVHQTGNIKFDVELVGIDGQENRFASQLIGLHDGEILIVAGSTHPKEEEELLLCYQDLLEEYPQAVFLMAPRHIERSDQLEDAIRSFGFEVVRRSRIGINESGSIAVRRPRVIVLDTRGELAHVYALARVTFVGGTFVPVGGHNLLEPASWGKPVLFGSFTDHCQEIADLLLESGGGNQVCDGREMASLVVKILNDQSLADRMGQAARQVVLDNQGVVKRNMELLRPLLESRR
jgi:3-deoxy-D-manno-octulosonic-acid transferase